MLPPLRRARLRRRDRPYSAGFPTAQRGYSDQPGLCRQEIHYQWRAVPQSLRSRGLFGRQVHSERGDPAVPESRQAEVPLPLIERRPVTVLRVFPDDGYGPICPLHLLHRERWELAACTPAQPWERAVKCGGARRCDHRLLPIPYWGPDLRRESLGARGRDWPIGRLAEPGHTDPAV